VASSTTYDVAAVRAHFPALVGGAAHFDGPGGSQTPDVVAQAIYDTLTSPLANLDGDNEASRNAEAAVHAGREAMADLLGADPASVVFGRSMTQLTSDLARTMAKDWGPGDEVVVTRLDHDGNVRPWVNAAEAVGATVRWAGFDPETGELHAETIGDLLSERTRVVAVTGASNLIGTRPALRGIADLVHRTDAWLYVDGVHLTPHAPVDVEAIGADIFVCSPYKFLGPHCGVLAGRFELLDKLRPDKLMPSSNEVPERFELGTLPFELMAGTTAAVDFLASLVPGDGSRRERLLASMTALEEHEDRLRDRVEDTLARLPGVRIWSRAARRTPTLLATFAGHSSYDVSRHLAEHGVNAPAGSFYAYEASRVMGLDDAGGVRIGLAPYNDDADVDRLLHALEGYFAG
jgi:cysteine desulfurase family protein (TIGR01976 family)